MNSDDITFEQALKIAEWMVPALQRLNQLRERMSERGFPSDDPLFIATVNTAESVRVLRAKFYSIEVYKNPDCPHWIRKNRKP